MPSKIPPQIAQPYSANDNGPLSPGQVKALKIAIAVMGVMIVAALLAIFGRVIYFSSAKKSAPSAATTQTVLAPQHQLALPSGAIVKNMSLRGNRLLVHYKTTVRPRRHRSRSRQWQNAEPDPVLSRCAGEQVIDVRLALGQPSDSIHQLAARSFPIRFGRVGMLVKIRRCLVGIGLNGAQAGFKRLLLVTAVDNRLRPLR